MTFIERLKKLFGREAVRPERKEPIVPSHFTLDEESGLIVQTDDPVMARVIGEAFQSGKPVIGTVDDSGRTTIRKLEP
ncbi:MAG: hypothetical protein ACK4NR_05985 [Micavibrio sp.]